MPNPFNRNNTCHDCQHNMNREIK